jgi:hypothetical protein
MADLAGDLDDLRGVREPEPTNRDRLERADLDPAAPTVGGPVQDGGVVPGQPGAAVQQGGLVGLDGDQVVGLRGGHEELGVFAVGVYRVGSDDRAGQVQAGQERLEAGTSPGRRRAGVGGHGAGGVVIAASTCTRRRSWPWAPRSVLPSTVTTRRRRPGSSRSASHAPIEAASASASTRASVRRIVVSSGGVRCPVKGSCRTPSAARTGSARQRPISAIAVIDRAPASTAAAATARTPASGWRHPLAGTRVRHHSETAEQVRGFGRAQRGGVVQRGQAGWDPR